MTEEVNDNWDNEDSHWCDKTFGDTYIPSTSAKRLNQDFANAVCKCKMQNRQKEKLTSREKKDVEKWVGKKNDASSRATISSMTLVERMSKKSVKEGNKKKADSISVDDDDGDNTFDHVFNNVVLTLYFLP